VPDQGVNALPWLIAAVLVAVLLWWGRRALAIHPFRKENAHDFVHVEEDGAVRELTMDERAYLNTTFTGDDGARPYIKTSYWSRGPGGSRSGFIYRSLGPGHVRIRRNS
jgi:hypothetical protein